MPFLILRNDITKMKVDAIVNSANPRPVIGAGTDAMIHEAAGPALLTARQKIGHIPVGSARITEGYGLAAKYVIHTVGPVWRGGLFLEERKLRGCYDESLKLALEYGCRSIAFPLISTGNYGFPQNRALRIATDACIAFLSEHEMQIYLVVFDSKAFQLSEQLFQNVASYIDQHYVDEAVKKQLPPRARPVEWDADTITECYALPTAIHPPAPAPAAKSDYSIPLKSSTAPKPKAASLEEMLKQTDAGFTETLLKLIDKTGKKDSEIYKKACISKQHFSKIRNNPDYKPTKTTAIALALALELNLEATRDLIGRAGYALTNSSKFDLIIRYFIEQGNYNVVEINLALYEFDQILIGN